MPRTPDELIVHLERLTAPGFRERLVSRGLARGLIWRDGTLPAGAPAFTATLTTDLLDHGLQCLTLALQLRDFQGNRELVARSLNVAAECIESAVRYGSTSDVDRPFHLTIAAAAFHIGGYSARAFSLFAGDLARLNLASYERALIHLMRRDLAALREGSASWLQAPGHSDDAVVDRLAEDDAFSVDDVLALSLTRTVHTALSLLDAALSTGNQQLFADARHLLGEGLRAASDAHHVPLWWSFLVARHLVDDLWGNSFHMILPAEGGPPNWPRLRRNFIQLVASRRLAEIDLWPSQLEAASRVLDAEDDLVVALPTSAGKTRIAELCILRALSEGKRVIYVTPLRALSAQVELTLAATFCPLSFSVTSVYGASGVAMSDLDTLKSAKIVVATPEKLDFAVRLDPSIIDDVGLIVLDEGHMIGLGEREIRYEMLVHRLLRRPDANARRLVCLSAVFTEGEAFDDFTQWMRSDAPGSAIRSTWRPTRQRPGIVKWTGNAGRLEFSVNDERPFVPGFVGLSDPHGQRHTPFPKDAQELAIATTNSFLARGQTVLIYCPMKKSVEATAKAFLKAHDQGYFDACIDADKLPLLETAQRLGNEWLGAEHPAVACLTLGIAVHHGGLPRQFLNEIESLLRRRILPVCVSSPTLAQGLDLSFGVLLFRSLYRNRKLIPTTEFANVIGRVGRAFVDLDGLYVLPVFEETVRKTSQRIAEFGQLVLDARKRQLESGVRQLIAVILRTLEVRLGLSGDQLREYVLNQTSTWNPPPPEGGTSDDLLVNLLNELDNAILGIVDTLALPINELAAYLDTCLQGSYWRRRLERMGSDAQTLQSAVFRGRAQWLWTHSNEGQRKRYFASGVGHAAGTLIDTHSETFRSLLEAAEAAFAINAPADAIAAIAEIARIVFTVGPFVPENLTDDWEELLGHWIQGTALSECADSDGVSFIQGDVVFRLVWGVEAVRLHLQDDAQLSTVPGSMIALCLTYGVPNLQSALFMQAGISSRRFAQAVAEAAPERFLDMDAIRTWIYSILDNEAADIDWTTDADREQWTRFLNCFAHRSHIFWQDFAHALPTRWVAAPPLSGTIVRISRAHDELEATVLTASHEVIGTLDVPDTMRSTHFFGTVTADRSSVNVTFFGEANIPRYLME